MGEYCVFVSAWLAQSAGKWRRDGKTARNKIFQTPCQARPRPVGTRENPKSSKLDHLISDVQFGEVQGNGTM